MDILAQFDTVSSANTGAKLELTDANGAAVLKADGTPLTITLLGKDSDVWVKAENAARNRRLAQGPRMKLTAEALESEAIAALAKVTVAWDFDEPCTYEAAVRLYTRYPLIREQVDMFVGDRANFTKASPTS